MENKKIFEVCDFESCEFCNHGLCFNFDRYATHNRSKTITELLDEMKAYTKDNVEKYGKEKVLNDEENLKYATVTNDFYDLVYEIMRVNDALESKEIEAKLIEINPYLSSINENCPKYLYLLDEKLLELEELWWESENPPRKDDDVNIDIDE